MRRFIRVIYTLLLCCFSKVNQRGSSFLVVKTKGDGKNNNNIIFENAVIEFSKFEVDGSSNTIEVSGKHNKLRVQINGNNNIVYIYPETVVNGSTIIVRGDNCRVEIGHKTRITTGTLICFGKHNQILVGDDCMFAPYVEIWASDTHPIIDKNAAIINPSKPVCIGNHVWLGKSVKVLKGVTIGENAIVGMSSIVTKNIGTGTLNVGFPAHTVKENVNWNRNYIEC